MTILKRIVQCLLPALSICVNQCILTHVFAYTITEQLFIGSLLRMCLILKKVIHVKDTALKKNLKNFPRFIILSFQIKMRIDFVKFSKDAICPTTGSAHVAGFDLYSVKDVIIPLSNVKIVQTNIGFKIPKGYFGKFHARSSFVMQLTDVGSGVIDSDYRDPVVVAFFNFSNREFEINKGCHFAQIIFQKIATPTLREVSTFDDRTDH